jgi:VanZ family protein
MKDIIFKFIKYLYYFSLAILLILYLFPGSLIGYFFYGDLGKQPNIINNPFGTSINHLFYFSYLTTLGFIYSQIEKKFINDLLFILSLSIILELLHFFIPNRAFELYDLVANIVGVLLIFCLTKLKKNV